MIMRCKTHVMRGVYLLTIVKENVNQLTICRYNLNLTTR